MRLAVSITGILVLALGMGCRGTLQGPDESGEFVQLLPGATPPRNLLMISIDTLRVDRVGRYAAGESYTPHLDALMSEAAVLDSHFSCSNWTFPSISCVLGGRSAVDSGYVPPIMTGFPDSYPEEDDFLADFMKDEGYVTAMVAANGFLCPDLGVGDYDEVTCRPNSTATQISDFTLSTYDQALAGGGPWYLHAHYIDPHQPYNAQLAYMPPLSEVPTIPFDITNSGDLRIIESDFEGMPEDLQQDVLDNLHIFYSANVAYVDAEIRRLLDGLEERGALEDTLVVFWSDHGEQLLDHGGLGHTVALYGEETRALALFWAPGIIGGGSWSGLTTHADLLPTTFGVMGLPVPEQATGTPIGLRSAGRSTFEVQAWDDGSAQLGVTQDGWRMFYAWDGTKELYDLRDDPLERANIYDSEDPKVLELWNLMMPEVLRVKQVHGGEPVEVGP